MQVKEKKIVLVACAVALLSLASTSTLLTSCQSIDGWNDSTSSSSSSAKEQLVDVNVEFSGIDITTTPVSKASTSTATEAGVNTIVLKVFDSNNKVDTTVTQTSSDATNFGTIKIKLSSGTHKFVAVACNSNSAPTINSATEVSFGKVYVPRPVYTKVQDVTVSGETTQSVSIDMGKRVNSIFTVNITDATPANVSSLQIIVNPTASTYTDLKINPTTGLATTAMQFSGTLTKASASGMTFTNYHVSIRLLLTSDPQKLDVTINALDATGKVLYTRTLEDVSFQRAYNTVATGTFFSATATSTFLFDTTETTYNISLD